MTVCIGLVCGLVCRDCLDCFNGYKKTQLDSEWCHSLAGRDGLYKSRGSQLSSTHERVHFSLLYCGCEAAGHSFQTPAAVTSRWWQTVTRNWELKWTLPPQAAVCQDVLLQQQRGNQGRQMSTGSSRLSNYLRRSVCMAEIMKSSRLVSVKSPIK